MATSRARAAARYAGDRLPQQWLASRAVEAFAGHPDKDAAVWGLKPVRLNKNSNLSDPAEPQYIPSSDDDELEPYAAESLRASRVPLLPVATIATRNNPRIQAQLGTFTVHHTQKIAIEEVGDRSHVIKYRIPHACRETVHKELKLLGLTQFSLFPELTSVHFAYGGLVMIPEMIQSGFLSESALY
jgi:hypothetical protein